MRIEILRNGTAAAAAEAMGETALVFREEYIPGDVIRVIPERKGFITIQLDAVLGRATVFTDGSPFELPVPFGQKHDCYHEAVFRGAKHFLWARNAYEWESDGYRNLALNPYDAHENSSFFPHARANIETRGESVFAARNAIDGIVASDGHGEWPWSSWGINRDPEAELTLDFGRTVLIDRIVVYTRADFPHDAWWTEGTFSFSDGSTLTMAMTKLNGPQEIAFPAKRVSSLKLSKLIKADDPSPFPALVQLEVYGTEL